MSIFEPHTRADGELWDVRVSHQILQLSHGPLCITFWNPCAEVFEFNQLVHARHPPSESVRLKGEPRQIPLLIVCTEFMTRAQIVKLSVLKHL
ncbi:hypothetical protein KQX54_019334 [Cotesia glomerata]|uniref:Uncharacterized protein n=1 Tax=Cotesia glomerata TaxID=32391 RepID=A0AAV7I3S9_COTGL|nr:hypothetical protein KQX54_019334 [Cotesia glomerata]